jgi:uncharacterized repeat protein (TIGR02543 family)
MALATGHAEVITFNDVGYPVYDGREYHNPIFQPGYLLPTEEGNTLYLPGYSDGFLDTGGFRFSGQHFHTIDRPAVHGDNLFGGAPDNGTIYLNAELDDSITLTLIDGGPFSLISFDGAECFVNVDVAQQYGYLTATSINVTGIKLDGTHLSVSFALDGINDGVGSNQDFQTFILTPDWNNLISVTFAGLVGSNPAGFSLDNTNAVAGMVYYPSIVTINNKQLMVDGNPFTIKGVAYSPTPIGDDPKTTPPYGDYFTATYGDIYSRDLPLLRQMGANTLRIVSWNSTANHFDFLDQTYNNGVDPLFVIAGYWINSGLDIDPASATNVRDAAKADFRQMVASHKNHPSILMWSIGSGLNASSMYGGNLDNLFSLVNEMAAEAHLEEGASFHPVAVSLADENLIATIMAHEATASSIDLWGANVYRGNTFGNLFGDYLTVSNKPLVILECGIDAYDNANGNEYEMIGSPVQSEYAAALWSEIISNPDPCIGGTLRAYSDEWWKGAYSPDQNCQDQDPAFHGLCGYVAASHPDGYANMEWWGIMRPVRNESGPDTMEPRDVYYKLKSLWTYTLSLAVTPAAGGTTSPAAGTSHTYTEGTAVALSATPGSGYRFVNWTGDVTGIPDVTSSSITVTMNGNKNLTANFEATGLTPVPTFISLTPGSHTSSVGAPVDFSLTVGDGNGWQDLKEIRFVIKEGTGTATTADGIIVWWIASYPSRIYLWDHAQARWVFATLGSTTVLENTNGSLVASGCSIAGSGDLLTLNVRIIPKAAFAQTPLTGNKRIWLLARDIAGNVVNNLQIGTWRVAAGSLYDLTLAVTPAAGGTTSPAAGTPHTYAEGTAVAVSAAPGSGYRFVNWTGDVTGIPDVTSSSVTVTMNGNKNLTANFAAIPTYTLTLAVTPAAGGTTSPAAGTSHTYTEGTAVAVSATPGSGYRFVNWTGDVTGIPDVTSSSITVTMNGNKNLTANFEATGLTPVPTFISLTPGSHTSSVGAPVDFSLTVGDGNGWQDLKEIRFVIKEGTGTATTADGIIVWWIASYPSRIYLWDHAQARWVFATLGSTTVLENTNGSLVASGCSIAGSGDLLTLNVRIIPKAAFAQTPLTGNKRIWLLARDIAGNVVNNLQIGTWRVSP